MLNFINYLKIKIDHWQMKGSNPGFVKKYFFQMISKISKDEYYQVLIWKVLKELIKLIVILILIVLLLKEGIKTYPLQMNIIIMLILGLGITLDSRFAKSRVLIFLFMCIVQITVYKYLEYIPIVILKDIFWYTLVINLAFIWHVLILNWGYKISELLGYEYGTYICSRLSIITSLTMITFIIKTIYYIVKDLMGYPKYLKSELQWLEKKKRKELEQILTTDKTLKILEKYEEIFEYLLKGLLIILIILNYFKNIFNKYSEIVVGKNEKIEWLNLPKKVYLTIIAFFIITLGMSIMSGVPRLYLIWIIWSTIWIYNEMQLPKEQSVFSDPRPPVVCLNEELYVKNFLDYKIFYESWEMAYTFSINICDVLYIFLYFPGYKKTLILLGFGLYYAPQFENIEIYSSRGLLQNYLNENDLLLTEDEVKKELYGDLNESSISYLGDVGYNYKELIEKYGKLNMWTCCKMIPQKRWIYEKILKK